MEMFIVPPGPENPSVVAARKVNMVTCTARRRKERKMKMSLAVTGHSVPPPVKHVNRRVPVVQPLVSVPLSAQLYPPYYIAAPQLDSQLQSASTVPADHHVSYCINLSAEYTFMELWSVGACELTDAGYHTHRCPVSIRQNVSTGHDGG